MEETEKTETTVTEETTRKVPEVLEKREEHRISGTPDTVDETKTTTKVTEKS